MPRILVFADLHGDVKTLKRLMATDADAYFAAGDLVNWGRGLETMAEAMVPRASRVYAMPGNHESEADIAAICRHYGFTNFHGGIMELAGMHIAGLGYSNPTPFGTPGEYSEVELGERLAKFAGLSPLILICHAPPKDTTLDRIHEGLHAGSKAVREFIDKHQPKYFFCGHIHEAEGKDEMLGETRGRNVGKRGCVLEW